VGAYTREVSGDPSGSDVIEVWWLDLDVSDHDVEDLTAHLATEDALRVAALATEQLRRRAAVRLGLRRIVLAESLGVPAGRLELGREPSGRPYAVAPDGSRVSVSASSRGDVALVACIRHADLGVDVESASELGVAPRLIEEIASPSERAVLDALDASVRRDALLRLWTRKEALLKAIGTGIVEGLAHLTVPLDVGVVAAVFQPTVGGARWRCDDLACPRDGLAAALVVSTRDDDKREVRIRTR
jgi:4'-phosphopantetheinyl transferase